MRCAQPAWRYRRRAWRGPGAPQPGPSICFRDQDGTFIASATMLSALRTTSVALSPEGVAGTWCATAPAKHMF